MTRREFFHWWRGQLRDALPDPLRRTWQPGGACTTLKFDDNGVAVTGTDTATVLKLMPGDDVPPPPAATEAREATTLLQQALVSDGRSSRSEKEPSAARVATSADAVTDLLPTLPANPKRLRMQLAPGQFIVRRLSLPRAAQPHLAETVGYQVPLVTPFTTDQLLWACGIEGDSPPDGPLTVWLVAIPRQRIAQALTRLGLPVPPNPLPLDRPPADGQPLEVTWRPSAAPRMLAIRRPGFALAGLLALWLAAAGLHLVRQHQDSVALAATLATLRAEAAQVADLREQLTEAAARLEWRGERRTRSASTLVLWDELTRLLDDQTSLARMDLYEDTVTLVGSSASPPALVETLEDSPRFEGVQFGGYNRDGKDGVGRFTVRARLAAVQSGTPR